MKFVMTQSICPEGIEKLKADTNGQVEIIAQKIIPILIIIWTI